MSTFPFLSPAWLSEAESVVSGEIEGSLYLSRLTIRLIVTGGPDGIASVTTLGVSDGVVSWVAGGSDTPDATVTMDFDTARRCWLSLDNFEGAQAFAAGRVRVDASADVWNTLGQVRGRMFSSTPRVLTGLRSVTDAVDVERADATAA